MTKTYWLTDSRFKFTALALLFMWILFMVFFFMKAHEITTDPCTVCSERYSEAVVCTIGGTIPVSRNFYPNGTVVDTGANVYVPQNESEFKLKLNFTE